MNKLQSDLAPWLAELVTCMDSIENTGQSPLVHHVVTRVVLYGCCPIACSPCCAWSVWWRVIVCPVQCCLNGLKDSCSSNRCTNASDGAVVSCIAIANDRIVVPDPPVLVATSIVHSAHLDILFEIITHLEYVFEQPRAEKFAYTPMHYKLAESVVTPLIRIDAQYMHATTVLPSKVLVELSHIRNFLAGVVTI